MTARRATMRLYFKHILRSMRRKPTQPIILLLTLCLSVAITVCTLTLRSELLYERSYTDNAQLGASDIQISLNSTSESRFMFTSDVKRVLGEECLCAGYYEIFLSRGADSVFSAAAVDFDEIGNIFELEFTSYAGVNEGNRSYSAFISSDFAKKMKLSVGDEFEAELLGIENTYRVAGIAKHDFIAKFDILLDISGVSRVLASKYTLAAAVGDSFRPCNVILIDIPEGESVERAIAALGADADFEDKSVVGTLERGGGEANNDMLFAVINFAVIIMCIMAAVVSYSCFSILSAERAEETESFRAAGARLSLIYSMQYLEALMYWVCGAVSGVILSVPLLLLMRWLLPFKYAELGLGVMPAVSAALLLLLSLLASVSVFILNSRRKHISRRRRGYIAIFAAVCVILYCLMFALPIEYSMIIGTLSIVSVFLLVFLVSDELLLAVCGGILKRRDASLLSGEGLRRPALYYSVKNIRSVRSLRGVVKMISLLVAATLCVGFSINGMNGQVKVLKGLLNSEYVVVNATERCSDKLSACESVGSVGKLYFADGRHNGEIRTTLISTDSLDAISPDIGITYLPHDDEAVISSVQAKALGIEKGDIFTVTQNNEVLKLRLAGVVKTAISFVLFDCNYFGIDYTMLLPSVAYGYTADGQLEEISAVAAEEVASVISSESLNEDMLDSVDIYISSGNFLCSFVVIFSLIGIVDTFIECYRSREEELAMYETAGMSKRRVGRMKLAEISLSVAFALVVGIIAFALTLPLVNETMVSICYDSYESFLAWIG